MGGHYIFAGTSNDQKPFDLSKITNGLNFSPVENLNYYEGNSQSAEITVDTNTVWNIDIQGSHSGFEKTIRALKIASNPNTVASDDSNGSAQNLIDEAITELAGLVSTIGSNDKSLDELIELQTDTVKYMKEKHDEFVSVDELDIMVSLAEEQQRLTMLYQAIQKMNEMSSANYWK